MIAPSTESDEAFARRLQEQEMGINPDAQTPLVNRRGDNPTVVNARINEITTSRLTIGVIFAVNMPQVLATIIVLAIHWNDKDVCDYEHTMRWKWWSLFAALRMFLYSFTVLFMHWFKPWLEERQSYHIRAVSFRNTIDAFGLIWFVVGNLWLFGDDDGSCRHPEHSPIYNMCVSILVINYLQMCLPCIVAILLIPVFCFCMPCLIRVLARLHNPRATQGATEGDLETLPVITVDASHLTPGEENTCPICLSEMVVGESARMFRCKHLFHQQCVDLWLRENASCPTCRKLVFDSTGRGGTRSGGGGAAGGGGRAAASAGAAARGAVITSPLTSAQPAIGRARGAASANSIVGESSSAPNRSVGAATGLRDGLTSAAAAAGSGEREGHDSNIIIGSGSSNDVADNHDLGVNNGTGDGSGEDDRSDGSMSLSISSMHGLLSSMLPGRTTENSARGNNSASTRAERETVVHREPFDV